MKKLIFTFPLFLLFCSSAPRYYLPNADQPEIATGLTVFLDSYMDRYKGKKAALVTNQSGVNSALEPNIRLLEKKKIIVDRILVPEHGLYGFVDWPDSPSADEDLGEGKKLIHIQSLPPKKIREKIAGVDIVIFDIQGMGMRCYTYISELAALIDALDGTSSELIILDRPNPLIPYGVDGIMLDNCFKSRSTSYFPGPMNYALTNGEAALYYKDVMKRNLKLTVIPMKGYSRDLFYGQTGLPWIPPSPNLPAYKNAVIYSAAVYLEGTNISVGRGTPDPFEYIGAPWINAQQLSADLKKLKIRGFSFRPVYFKPAASIYRGQRCGGVQIFLTGEKFSACENAYQIMLCLKRNSPYFRWIRDAQGGYGLDILAGSDLFRKGLEKDIPYEQIRNASEAAREQYRRRIRKYLLY